MPQRALTTVYGMEITPTHPQNCSFLALYMSPRALLMPSAEKCDVGRYTQFFLRRILGGLTMSVWAHIACLQGRSQFPIGSTLSSVRVGRHLQGEGHNLVGRSKRTRVKREMPFLLTKGVSSKEEMSKKVCTYV